MDKIFTIELAQGAEIRFECNNSSHSIKVKSTSYDKKTDEISLNYNEKLRLIQWLVNSINLD